MIKAVPVSLTEAQNYINENHRHHIAAKVDKYRVGAEENGELVGVAQCGRPVARNLDDGKTIEVLRLCTNGNKNVCSFLYSRCARIAKELGYSKIITYILESESGASLKASGWHCEKESTGGGSWDHPSRRRYIEEDQISFFPQKAKYPTGKKQRWGKEL